MGYEGYDLGQDLEWDEAVITLIQTDIRHHQSFFVPHCFRGLPSDGLKIAALMADNNQHPQRWHTQTEPRTSRLKD